MCPLTKLREISTMFLRIFVVFHLGRLVQTNSLCISESFKRVDQVYMNILRVTQDNSTAGCSVQCESEQMCAAFKFTDGSCEQFADVDTENGICQKHNVYLRSNAATMHKFKHVRLTGPYYGRLEILYGSWGTVCDDGFTVQNAKVVCRQLGLPTKNAEVHGSAAFGQGSGDIQLDDVNCTGDESYLSQCCHLPWRSHNCVHGEDVSVICYQ